MSYFQHSCNWTNWENGERMCIICGFIQYKDGSHLENPISQEMFKRWVRENE